MFYPWKNADKILFALLLSACQPANLAVEKVELCDYFTRDGVCREPSPLNKKYSVEIPNDKKPQTWEDLANYLYFHARETPGFILRMNRKFSPEERSQIRETYFAMYEFSGVRGKMEGFEIGEDWIGSFNYLGSMIKEKQKKENRLKLYPYETSLFPSDLEFNWTAKGISGSTKTKIDFVYHVSPPAN
ncbi:hypothetical protein EHQ27_11245 [Leptospira wolffii]|uniref:complement regulator-acquiring protein LcpA n=1 Tax=Leptospira wolffii TaxID=409998 RepID=UPI001082B176|nr:hypothetical protein [Leptospira wolffii]TGK56945.1 hypothetical protein EHQ32_15325 [Leptospira wolffii]TGK70978.1 hypothetical protein EHQ27_11245 [Leptospira wolffii]TGK75669.1 hypothetical protein EHQ35_04695 [Leptospira wolffii]TGL32717.1 hypothetical protein EHQ57_01655 [Leptospira wolffii]